MVRLEPGLAAEKQFVEDAVDQAIAALYLHLRGGAFTVALKDNVAVRGVGLGRTTTHVLKDVVAAVNDELGLLASTIRTKVKEGLETAILDLKKQVKTEGR